MILGSTVPTTGGINKAFYWGDKWGCEAVQFYITLSRKWQVDEIDRETVNSFKDAWKRSNVKEVIAHIPYLVNLVSENETTRERSINRMISEIERAKVLGVRYLILHPGSAGKRDRKEAIDVLKESFKEIFDRTDPDNVKISLETMAGQGSALGSSFEELARILSVLNNEKVFDICFDSAHVLESGYDTKNYDKVFEEFEKHIPIKKISSFHLNDSKTDLGSGVDRHEHIGEGKVGIEFFKRLMNDSRFDDIPMILETPETENKSEKNLILLRNLIQK